MKTSLAHLPQHKQDDIAEVVELIKERIDAQMIILFGSYSRGDWVEKEPVEGSLFRRSSDYDILIVMDEESREESAVQAYVNHERYDGPSGNVTIVSIIIHGIDYLNDQLEDNNYFFRDLMKDGILLYDTGKHKLTAARRPMPGKRQRQAQEYYDYRYAKSVSFFKAFEFIMAEKDYSVAAFQLYHATESLFSTILHVFADHTTHISDLEILYRKVCNCNARFMPVFTLQAPEAMRKFFVLRNAVTDSRYKPDYSVSPTDLEWLATRVQKLRELTEVICKEKIEGYGR